MFLVFLRHFVLAKSTTSSMWVKQKFTFTAFLIDFPRFSLCQPGMLFMFISMFMFQLSQILGHSEQLYIKLPRGLRIWQFLTGLLFTVIAIWVSIK